MFQGNSTVNGMTTNRKTKGIPKRAPNDSSKQHKFTKIIKCIKWNWPRWFLFHLKQAVFFMCHFARWIYSAYFTVIFERVCFLEFLQKPNTIQSTTIWNESWAQDQSIICFRLFATKRADIWSVCLDGRMSFIGTGEKFNGNNMTPCRWQHENKHTFDVCPMCRPPHDDVNVHTSFYHNFLHYKIFALQMVFPLWLLFLELVMVARGPMCYHRAFFLLLTILLK